MTGLDSGVSRVVLITGGGSGIGREAAYQFAASGASVVVACRRIEEGEKTVAQIRANGGEASFIQTDVTSEEQVAKLVAGTVERYGRLDVAVNGAGAEPAKLHALADMPTEELAANMAVNFYGVFYCMKYEIRQMLTQSGGAIVNIGSIATVIGSPTVCDYTASKHAMLGLSRTAALEYVKQGIRINLVSPGPVANEMTARIENADAWKAGIPAGRFAENTEICSAILWLASPGASFVTGQNIMVDGGITVA